MEQTQETPQVEKFKKKIVFFKALNLEQANKLSKKIKVTNSKKSYFKGTPVKIVEDSVLNRILESKEGEIPQFIHQLHPDLQNFLHHNKIAEIKATSGNLVIITKTKFRVQVKVFSKFINTIVIKLKNEVIFEGKSIAYFK